MNWEELERKFGKHPNGTIVASALWASRVENYLRMKAMEKDMEDTTEKWLSKIFDYHNPTDIPAIHFEELRAAAKSMSRSVLANGGHHNGEDIDKAIEHIRVALYYAIASIVVPKG